MLAPITPTLATAFDVPLGLAAQAFGANLLGRLVLMIPSGYLVDRFGPDGRDDRRPNHHRDLRGHHAVYADLLVAARSPVRRRRAGGLWQLGRELIAVDLVSQRSRGRMMSMFIGISTAGVAIGPLMGGR